ncbi:CAP domain-containing protein [Phycicoccus flavus]|uniref:CAP domain-containing protein n=1 Tax=Phycicoccus flavus TaxID=2502783 RepID=UPI000FEB6CB6|nr:CAP domain-containing protein [Phycicoccus flavus]NHA69261.1 CAP domain-containing protein [Phycicoccus flavus]
MPSSPRALLVRAALAAAVLVPAGLVSAQPAAAYTNAELEGYVVTFVNAERRKVGCANLRTDARLRTAARKHSWSMKTYDFFSHTSRDGRTPWDRMRNEGYAYPRAENIAAGQRRARDVVAAWMNSPGHRANILDCRNKAVGVGLSRGRSTYGYYWTQDFGSR